MESVYIETSVVSYRVVRPLARTVAHQWHVWTKAWWRLRRPYFECVISAEVLREAAAGDPKTSRQRLRPVAERHGHRLPVVCTPLQLMGEIQYED